MLYLWVLKIVKHLTLADYQMNLTDKIDSIRKEKVITLSNLNIYHTWKIKKNNTTRFRISASFQHVMKKLNYLMDHIIYQIFKIILNINLKRIWKDTSYIKKYEKMI